MHRGWARSASVHAHQAEELLFLWTKGGRASRAFFLFRLTADKASLDAAAGAAATPDETRTKEMDAASALALLDSIGAGMRSSAPRRALAKVKPGNRR